MQPRRVCAADPLSILDQSEDNLQETIGWFRHAEIKHGRVAMAAFVGYCVQANGIYFPWKLTGGPNPIMHADISAAGSPADQWDALPFEAKCQIIVCHFVHRTPDSEPRQVCYSHVRASPWTGAAAHPGIRIKMAHKQFVGLTVRSPLSAAPCYSLSLQPLTAAS